MIMFTDHQQNILRLGLVYSLVVLSTQYSVPGRTMKIADVVRELVNEDYDDNSNHYR